MKAAILIIALCAASAPVMCQSDAPARTAMLPSTVGLHLTSVHSNSGSGAPGALGWNNRNTGAFLGWRAGSSQILGQQLQHTIIAGGFKNSLREESLYAGLDTTSEPIHTRAGRFNLSLSAALLTGYDRPVRAYIGGATVPEGHTVKVRCTAQLGCQKWLTKPTILLAITPGIDWQPAIQHAPILRLSYLHDSGGTGSKAVHLTSRWSF